MVLYTAFINSLHFQVLETFRDKKINPTRIILSKYEQGILFIVR